MKLEKVMIILKGDIREDVAHHTCGTQKGECNITFNDGNIYTYKRENYKIITHPTECDVNLSQVITKDGDIIIGVNKILEFKSDNKSYLRVFWEDGAVKSYKPEEATLCKKSLNTDYINYCRKINDIIKPTNDKAQDFLGAQLKKFRH